MVFYSHQKSYVIGLEESLDRSHECAKQCEAHAMYNS